MPTSSSQIARGHRPAPVRRRVAAITLDNAVIATYLVALTLAGIAARTIPGPIKSLFGDPVRAQIAGFATLTLPVTLYFALSEAHRQSRAPRNAHGGSRRERHRRWASVTCGTLAWRRAVTRV